MNEHKELETFAYSLGDKIVLTAKEILNKYELTETLFSVFVITNPVIFQIRISCNEFIYETPEINIFTNFVGSEWEKQLNDFITSYGRFLAYDYLKYCNIEYNLYDEQVQTN